MNDAEIIKTIRTFTNPYGLFIRSDLLVGELARQNGTATAMGAIIRDVKTKTPLLACSMPLRDVTHHLLYVPIDARETLEALPFVANGTGSPLSRLIPDGRDYYVLTEGPFSLAAHHSLRMKGVVGSYDPVTRCGTIHRARKDISFRDDWCLNRAQPGQEVAFIPVVTRQGLQARAVTV